MKKSAKVKRNKFIKESHLSGGGGEKLEGEFYQAFGNITKESALSARV